MLIQKSLYPLSTHVPFDVAAAAPYHFDVKSISINFPDALAEQLEKFVRDGWVADREQAVVEALRRYLDSHRPEVTERQVLDDVEWGLHGRD